MSRDDATVLDMLRAVHLVTEFTQDKDFAALERDAQLQSAVPFQLLVLGEAVKRLSDSFRNRYSEIRGSGSRVWGIESSTGTMS